MTTTDAGGDGQELDGHWPGYVPILEKYHGKNPFAIFFTCPHATDVRGFHDWLKAGRAVKKGEKGILIFVPCRFPLLVRGTDDGQQEVIQWRESVKKAYVFDISQTAPREEENEA